MSTAKLTPSDKSITWRQRQASMDETLTYFVHNLAVNGEDVSIWWDEGILTIHGIDTGMLHEATECNSFTEAEAIIEHHCLVKFDHENVRWTKNRGSGQIARPVPRR